MTRPRGSALCVVLLAAVGLGGCSSSPGEAGKKELHVSAAMSLKEAFTDLEAGFEAEHPGVDLVFNFAGSQILAAQIVAGAPADVFASADRAQMERAATSNRMLPARVFARNHLVIVAPAGDPSIQGPADLARPGLRLVLAGESVPVGAYAREALQRVGVRDAALANVVSNEENVRGVLGKVAAGEADAGVVYATDVGGELAGELRAVAFAGADDVVPAYEIAALADSPQPALAGAFVELVAGPAGAAALGKRGFLPP
ncbi:molybdate transport system substrate-binding protein [Nannocystis exedens]|uniref:Molybdate transport system substrate-binding protein n=1 Tax=Nannocystis exedens TaxID=54 RepID=A0A1I2HT24_9BACT|nr:molybdate ABC transporter substrate-binding protein [Nannocystis exedens]PCC69900.1 molybdate-binding protein [Nannocystis exedens]SFF32583.1 molybdate transport system substrate-binding protein [Nannocystis exedens]